MIPDQQSIAEYRAELFGRFTGNLAEYAKKIPEEILATDEVELTTKFLPKVQDHLMRKRITDIFKQRKEVGDTGEIEAIEIYDGIIAQANFYRYVITNPYRLAWILTPLSSYQDIIDDAAYHGMMRMRKAMMSIELNEKTLSAFAKMVEFFNIRSKGVPVQKIQQLNTNVSVDGNKAIRDVLDAGQIEEKLKELKAKVVSLPADMVIADEPE